jgi:rhodanese-related sulfurtransferase
MSKKKSNASASKRGTQLSRPAARRSPSIWVLSGLGLLVVIVVAVLILQGTGTGTTSAQVAGVPAAAASTTSLPAEISVAEAAAKRDAGAFILDVREPNEWADYHIPGATLIPLGQLSTRVNEVPRDKEVVVVCHSGNRSAKGRDVLAQAGFTNVTSMAGGLLAWMDANQPTVTGP